MTLLFRAAALAAALLFPAAATAEPLRIGYPAGMNGQIVTILDKAGLAKAQGLEAETVFFQNGPPMMEAFASGQLDIAVTSLQPFATFAARLPGQAVIVSGLGHSTYALLVKPGHPAERLADLKGRKIAVSFGSDSHLDLLVSLGEAGLDATQVELLNIQPAELPVALEQGHADAIVIRQPQVLKLRQSAGAKLLHSWPHRYVVLARAEALRQRPDDVRRLLTALRHAVAFAGREPDQAAAWFGEKLRVDAATVRAVSAENPLIGPTDPDKVALGVTPELRAATTAWAAAALKFGLIKTPLAPDTLFAANF